MTVLNNDILEANAIAELDRKCTRSRIMKPILQKDDKIPLWDGEIFIYGDTGKFSNEEIIGRIPVQVKSTCVNEISRGIIYHPIEVIALRKYLNDGGIFYVKGEVKEANEDEEYDETKLYYASLLPLDLKSLLKEIDESDKKRGKKQKTKNIKLKPLPKGKDDFIEIIKNFYVNRNEQAGLRNIEIEKIDLKKIEKIEIIPSELEGLGEKYYAYGYYSGVKIPLSYGFLDNITENNKCLVQTEGGEIETEFKKTEYSSGEYSLSLNNITFKVSDKKIILNFRMDYSNVREALKSAYIFRDIKNGKGLSVNGHVLNINVDKSNEFSQLENDIEILEACVAILDKYGITDVVSLERISKKYAEFIVKIYKGIILNETIISDKGVNSPYIFRFVISDKEILLFQYKNKIYDFYELFDSKMGVFTNDNIKNRISYYPFLKKDDLLCINFDSKIVLNSIKKYSITEEVIKSGYIDNIVQFVLSLIRAYDISENEIYLTTALEILSYFYRYIDKDVIFINETQILKRLKRDISDRVTKLINLKNNGNMEMKCLCSILLGSKEEYDYYFNKLPEEEKKHFLEYPILKLI